MYTQTKMCEKKCVSASDCEFRGGDRVGFKAGQGRRSSDRKLVSLGTSAQGLSLCLLRQERHFILSVPNSYGFYTLCLVPFTKLIITNTNKFQNKFSETDTTDSNRI